MNQTSKLPALCILLALSALPVQAQWPGGYSANPYSLDPYGYGGTPLAGYAGTYGFGGQAYAGPYAGGQWSAAQPVYGGLGSVWGGTGWQQPGVLDPWAAAQGTGLSANPWGAASGGQWGSVGGWGVGYQPAASAWQQMPAAAGYGAYLPYQAPYYSDQGWGTGAAPVTGWQSPYGAAPGWNPAAIQSGVSSPWVVGGGQLQPPAGLQLQGWTQGWAPSGYAAIAPQGYGATETWQANPWAAAAQGQNAAAYGGWLGQGPTAAGPLGGMAPTGGYPAGWEAASQYGQWTTGTPMGTTGSPLWGPAQAPETRLGSPGWTSPGALTGQDPWATWRDWAAAAGLSLPTGPATTRTPSLTPTQPTAPAAPSAGGGGLNWLPFAD